MTTLPAATAPELQTAITVVPVTMTKVPLPTVPVPVIMVPALITTDPVMIAIHQAHTSMILALTITSPVRMTMDPVLTTVEKEEGEGEEEEEEEEGDHPVMLEVDHRAHHHVDLLVVQVADPVVVHPIKFF